jgi:hypothetical protein
LFPKLVSADVADAATFANLLPGSSCSELHHGSTNSSYLQSDINVAAPEHRGQSSKVRFRPRIVRFETNLFDAPVLPDCTAPDKPAKIRFRTNAVRFRANVFAGHRLFLNQVETAARPDRAEGTVDDFGFSTPRPIAGLDGAGGGKRGVDGSRLGQLHSSRRRQRHRYLYRLRQQSGKRCARDEPRVKRLWLGG